MGWKVVFYPSTLVGLAELLAERGAAKQRGEGATQQSQANQDALPLLTTNHLQLPQPPNHKTSRVVRRLLWLSQVQVGQGAA